MDLKGNTSKAPGCGEPEAFSTINISEYLQVQRTLLEIVEELKLRRHNDKENEERMQALMRENYEIAKKYDSEQKKSSGLEDQYQKQVQEVRFQYEEKLTNLQEEMNKYEVVSSCKEEEITTLKEEIRNLQLAKYISDKQVKDLEQKIQLQQMSSEHRMKQMSQIEVKFNSVASQIKTLISSQHRLERNVQDACTAQQKLAYVNNHQKCILKQYKADLTSSQHALMKNKVESQCTREDAVRLRQIQMEVNRYKQQIDKVNVEKTEILAQVTNSNQKYDFMVESLSESNHLLEEQRTKANEHKQDLQVQKKYVKVIEEQLKTLQEQLHHLTTTLDIEKSKIHEQKEQWKKELGKLSADLSLQTNKENIRTFSKEIETESSISLIPDLATFLTNKENMSTYSKEIEPEADISKPLDLSDILESPDEFPDEFPDSVCLEETESSMMTEDSQPMQTDKIQQIVEVCKDPPLMRSQPTRSPPPWGLSSRDFRSTTPEPRRLVPRPAQLQPQAVRTPDPSPPGPKPPDRKRQPPLRFTNFQMGKL